MNFYDYKVTSPYGSRTNPMDNTKTEKHNGIDFALPLNTFVNSNVSGTVTKSEFDYDGYGHYVVIKDGTGRLHYYAHLNNRIVNVGDEVNVGDSIGLSGSTGRSTGPHLHYEVREQGYSVNPSSYLTMGADASQSETEIPSTDNAAWYDVKGKLKAVVFNIFKFIIIALLIVLFVVFITKALDINII